MNKKPLVMFGLVLASVWGCSTDDVSSTDGGADATSTADAAVADAAKPAVPDATIVEPDAAPTPDAATPDAATTSDDFYMLGGSARTVPTVVECRNNVVSGRAPDRTGLTFYFLTQPTAAGTYTLETFPAAPNTFPTGATGVNARYGSDPVGGGGVTYNSTPPGTVTVTVVGGKIRVEATNLPANERTAGTAGTLSARLTCP